MENKFSPIPLSEQNDKTDSLVFFISVNGRAAINIQHNSRERVERGFSSKWENLDRYLKIMVLVRKISLNLDDIHQIISQMDRRTLTTLSMY